VNLGDSVSDEPGALGVKPSEWFVQHNNTWFEDEDARKADEAFFAAAQVVRDPVCKMARVDSCQCLTSALWCFVIGNTVVLEAEQHVIEDRGRDELRIGVLKHESNLFSRVLFVVFSDRRAVDDKFAVV
jgi:hypothetical protein